jgi:toxin secretion/phage lysis holin
MMFMKEFICTIIGAIGGFVAAIFGGWDSAFVTLLIFMAVDFATGLITAAMGRSDKSVSGKLNSSSCWQGLAKKVCVLMLIIVAVRVDILLGTTYVRDAVCIGFCCNELISIIENTGLMGVHYPAVLNNAIELLQKKSGSDDSKED